MWYREAYYVKPIKNLYPSDFWVNGKKKNELGEIVPPPKKIIPGQEMGTVAWGKLLGTGPENVNDESKLLNFLSTRIFEDAEGKKIYYNGLSKSILLPNPIRGGFWVEEEKKNELGEKKFIDFGKPFTVTEWNRILKTKQINGQDKDSLKKLLTDDKFEIIDDKRFYVPIALGKPNLLSNPIEGGFWINEEIKDELGEIKIVPRLIEFGEPYGVKAWRKLLNTNKINGQDKDSLKKFLTNDRFKNIGDKKFYIPTMTGDAVPISNPISERFYVDGVPVEPDEKKNISEWSKLLRTDVLKNKKQTFREFLSDKLIRNEEGNLIYSYNPQSRSKLFQNPIPEGFYMESVDGDFIEPSRTMGVDEWMRLLSTSHVIKASDKNSLRNFLNQDGKLTEIDGKKVYRTRKEKQYLRNPDIQGFWVGKRFIEPGEPISKTEWRILLHTAASNVKNEENLKDFLSDTRRFDTFNNKRTYKPVKRSFREGLFGQKFNSYNHDDITVNAGQYIIVMTNKTNILYLDFAFMKNGNILLAVEINGYQHYGFVSFGKKRSYNEWQDGLKRDVLKINYCHDNKIPLLIFNHMLSLDEFKTIVNNLHKNPHAYDNFIPQPAIGNNPKNTSLEFIKRQIYSHFYPVFNGTITFENDESKKRYIKDTLILISKLMGIYEGDIDKTDYINSFDLSTDLTSNYNICLSMYNLMYPDYPLDRDEKITFSNLSKIPPIYKEKPPIVKKPKETNLVPTEEFKDKDNVV